ncbi:MAG: twin-arginine translocase subunit TatB [Rhizobiales bacterium]|nr:twin-arginine translocase subunit TatB [Hyphomicrobiales bacterium]
MFDIGWGELVIIGIVALIAIGPKELPTVLRTLGQWMGKVRRMASDFQGQFQEAMREAEVADLKKQFDDAAKSAQFGFDDPLETARKAMQDAVEGAPEKPTSTDTSPASSPETAPATEPAAAQPAEAALTAADRKESGAA